MTINIPTTSQPRIVIVGGGFAGLEVAKRMAKTNFQIVLIDKNNYHQFQPLFYQVAMAGLEPSSIAFPLRKTFQRHKNVFIRVTEALEVNQEASEVITSLGTLKYDYLVLAMGADTNFFGNETLASKSISMKSVAEALYLRNSILTDLELAVTETDLDIRQGYLDIVIVGGGATGVEVAGALAEMRNYILPKDYPELNCQEIDIYVVQSGDTLLKGMSAEASASALKFLEDLGVKVIFNNRVIDYDGEQVLMKDGTNIKSKKVIWAAGIIGNTIKGLAAENIVGGNRIKVNRYNQVENSKNIYAIGDIAYMTEAGYEEGHPQVAQVAIQQAQHLVKNLQRQLHSQPLREFSYKNKGSMATIGRHRAVVDLPRIKFQGFFAWLIWLAVHLFALIGVKNKLFVFINWVWNYVTYDQSLRLLIKPKVKHRGKGEG